MFQSSDDTLAVAIKCQHALTVGRTADYTRYDIMIVYEINIIGVYHYFKFQCMENNNGQSSTLNVNWCGEMFS